MRSYCCRCSTACRRSTAWRRSTSGDTSYDGDNGDEPGPAGSGAIEETFASYFRAQRLPAESVPFEFRSDYVPFFDIGIPVGGVHSGFDGLKTVEQARIYGGTAGVAYDPNYHQSADNLGNVNTTVLHHLADATAHAAVTLAAAPPVTRSIKSHTTASGHADRDGA